MGKRMFGLTAGMALLGAAFVSPAAPTKIKVCHVTAADGTGHVIEVSANAVAAHIGHGDATAPGGVKGSACAVPGSRPRT